ncbi:MAG: FAD-dependent oxidoreductase [Candidatus Omnitrophica bacterium]|nr:FAD-dependent oxidoreductase [Candidatus Omnitrophota bacterium]
MKKFGKQLDRTDIVVVGAGLAGVCAAIIAARRGARVTLIEKENIPGGTAAGMRHRYLCGLFLNSDVLPRKYLNGGLTKEICEGLSPGVQPVRMGKVWLFPCDPQRLVIVLEEFLKHEKNIKVLYSSKILTCNYRGRHIESVRYSHHGKYRELKAAVFIDAGAGILLQKCGAAQLSDSTECPMSGFSLEMVGVTWDDVLPIRVPYVLYQAVKQRRLPLYARWTVVSTTENKERLYLKLSVPAGTKPALAKKISFAIVETLRRELPAFNSGKIAWQAHDVFSRDGDRLEGEYILKEKDVIKGKKFSDVIMKGAWPIEFWDPKRGPTYKYPNEDYYELPERSVKAKNVSNLFSSGRSVSAEPGAQASLRAGGLCLATGEAAGNAAVDYLKTHRAVTL